MPEPLRRPTHKDIAARAATSPATVSLVLNKRDGALRISHATREAVLAAARELGYVPDLSARRLSHRDGAASAPALALAVLRPAGAALAQYSHLLAAAKEGLAGVPGWPQLLIEEFEPGRLRDHPGLRAAAARFHGALLSGITPEDEAFLDEGGLPVPVVAFQRRLARQAYVDVDNVAGAAAATRHLLRAGRRRVAAVFVRTPPSQAQLRRLDGYRAALEEAGLAETARVEWAPVLDAASGAAATGRLLDGGRPDAIFASGDQLAIGVLYALNRRGLRVPEDVAVVGYDDIPFAPYLIPALSSVRIPFEEMGWAAVEWLAATARGQSPAPLQRVYAPELIARDSSRG